MTLTSSEGSARWYRDTTTRVFGAASSCDSTDWRLGTTWFWSINDCTQARKAASLSPGSQGEVLKRKASSSGFPPSVSTTRSGLSATIPRRVELRKPLAQSVAVAPLTARFSY